MHTVFSRSTYSTKCQEINGAISIYIPWIACASEARKSWIGSLHERVPPARVHPGCDLTDCRKESSKNVWSTWNGNAALGLQRNKTEVEIIEKVWSLPCALYISWLPRLNKSVVWIWVELKGFQEFLWSSAFASLWYLFAWDDLNRGGGGVENICQRSLCPGAWGRRESMYLSPGGQRSEPRGQKKCKGKSQQDLGYPSWWSLGNTLTPSSKLCDLI